MSPLRSASLIINERQHLDGTSASRPIPIYKDDQVILEIKIFCAKGIDNEVKYPHVKNRWYKVFGHIEGKETEEFCTKIKQDPCWNSVIKVSLDSALLLSKFVRLEIVRYGAESDPGSSTRTVVVGRTKVPIPLEFDRSTGKLWYELARYVNKDGCCMAEGLIEVELEKKLVVKKRSRRFY